MCEFYRFQIFIAHSRWNLFLQVSEQERFLESQVVHFGIGTPSRILKLIQNGERALFVISRLQIASLHAFSHDARLLSKPRSSPSILLLRHDHGTIVSSPASNFQALSKVSRQGPGLALISRSKTTWTPLPGYRFPKASNLFEGEEHS